VAESATRKLQENPVSDESNFDPKKFKDDLRDRVNKLKDDIHEQVHREVHTRLNFAEEKGETRRRPMVIGIAIRGRGRGGIITGAILMVVGLAFLLDNLGYISIGSLWRFWPMLLVLAGVLNFLYRRRAWGTLLMLVGILLQLNQLGKIHFGWAQIWPMALIALGLFVMWGTLEGRHKSVGSASGARDPRTTLNEAVVFGGLERRMTSQDFRGGDITAIFGGVELDLSEASMQANEATLAITAIFGGVEVRVPPNWQVAFRGAPIFGGIEDKTRTARVDDPSNPNLKVLVITGAVIFGGLEIKN
jgi:predicted membrane protein